MTKLVAEVKNGLASANVKDLKIALF